MDPIRGNARSPARSAPPRCTCMASGLASSQAWVIDRCGGGLGWGRRKRAGWGRPR